MEASKPCVQIPWPPVFYVKAVYLRCTLKVCVFADGFGEIAVKFFYKSIMLVFCTVFFVVEC